MATSDLTGAVREAMSATRVADAEEGIKDAVAKELGRLDPLAKVERTAYFNHSFAPDFVLTWQDGRSKSRRDVFLRPSLRAGVFSDDLTTIRQVGAARQSDSFMLALRRNQEPDVVERAEIVSAATPEVLVTDVQALDELGASHSDESPIRSLVQANIVKGGKGLVLEAQVSELVALEDIAPTESVAADDFLSVIRRNFNEQAVARIQRTSQVLAMGLTGDLSILDPADEHEAPKAVGGKLSRREVQLILPFLLRAENVTSEPRFWAHLGTLLSLEALEDVSASLTNLDLSRLVIPNLATWRANRAALALVAPEEAGPDEGIVDDPAAVEEPPALPCSSQEPGLAEAEVGLSSAEEANGTSQASATASENALSAEPSKPLGKRAAAKAEKEAKLAAERAAALDPRGRWMMHARMISTVVGDYRLHVTATAQRLKAHPGLTVRWSDVQPILQRFDLAGVDVLGVDRSLALRSTSVVTDIEAISETVTDDYHVATVQVKASDEAVVSVQFSNSIAIAASVAPAGELGIMALRLLGYRRPIPEDELARVFPEATES